jgi:branched-chain amino acid transport system substrate-binding protein
MSSSSLRHPALRARRGACGASVVVPAAGPPVGPVVVPGPGRTVARGVVSVVPAVLVVLLAATGCRPAAPEPLQPVKLGAIASTSGALGTFGEGLQKSVRLAVEQVNAAGGVFDGRPLELVVQDSASDPDTAAAAARALVDAGVAAIVGPETSGQATAVVEVLTPAQVPMVSCCATSAALSANNAPGSGFFFRTAPSDALQGKALAYLAERGVQEGGLNFEACPQAAVFARPDSYGEGFQRIFCENYADAADCTSSKIVTTGTFASAEPSQADIDAAAATFADAIMAEADLAQQLCVVFITFGFEGARLVGKLEQELSVTSLSYHYLTGDGAQEAGFLRELGNAPSTVRARLIGTVPYHALSTAYDQFENAFVARHGEPPGAYAAQAFDATFVTALAISQARSTTGVDVRNALFSVSGREGGVRFEDGNFFGEIAARILDGDDVDYVGPSGELTFSDVGDVEGDYVIWQVESQGGNLSFVDKVPLAVATFNPQ